MVRGGRGDVGRRGGVGGGKRGRRRRGGRGGHELEHRDEGDRRGVAGDEPHAEDLAHGDVERQGRGVEGYVFFPRNQSCPLATRPDLIHI